MGEFQAEGGGVHPGKPIIWPTSKSTPVSSSSQAETTGQAKNVPTQSSPASAASRAAPTQQAQAGAQATVAGKPAQTISRALTVEDLRSHLLSLQLEPSDANTQLASLMVRNGLEISRSNFVKIMTMLQGTDKSQTMQEAAVVLLMKGIDSPAAAKMLGQMMTENPQLAAQLSALQSAMGNLSSALGAGKALMDPALLAQLTALLAQVDESFQNLSNKFSGKGELSKQLGALNDVRALKALLQGLKEKAPAKSSPESQALASALAEVSTKLDSLQQNFIAQALLSQTGRQEVNYHYQQIPNAMTTPNSTFEIVVKRQGEGKEAQVDPRNTQVVIAMETTQLGKMVITMIVKDNKVYVVFVFNEKEYGDEGRGLIAKQFGEFQQKLADKNFLITGYQVKVDPALCKIRPYLIPMLANLDEVMRKIDLEA